MGRVEPRALNAALKKRELSRIYYLYGADVAGVEKMTKLIIKAAVGDNEEFALTKIDGKEVDMAELEDLSGQFNMMSEYNCILINDFDCEKPYYDMRGKNAEDITNQLIKVLKNTPEQTIIILNVTGLDMKIRWDSKKRANVIKDRNKKLADLAEKMGTLCEFPIKTSSELAKIIAAKVSSRGGAIGLDNARELAELCLCDELVIGSEIEKLCAYADGREITRDMIRLLVHQRDDTSAYDLANAVAALNAKAAFEAIDRIKVDSDNRVQVLYAITSAFLDLYRVACGKAANVPFMQVGKDFNYGARAFAVEKAYRASSRMSIQRLRKCIIILRDTTMQLNSSPMDPRTAIEQAVTKMLLMGQLTRG